MYAFYFICCLYVYNCSSTEFINTERNYLTTLKILQKVYARGLQKELYYTSDIIDKLFPLIDDHVEYVSAFVQKLTERQQKNKVSRSNLKMLLNSGVCYKQIKTSYEHGLWIFACVWATKY